MANFDDEMTARTQMLVGDKIQKIRDAHVLLCGLGGVGGYALEALARAGVGHIDVLDGDTVSPSNVNRQILATVDTVGKKKTEVAVDRIKSINPNCEVKAFDMFYLPSNAGILPLDGYDYVIDAIDTVTAKIDIIVRAKTAGVNVITCMGTGNKLGTDFKVVDISKTKVCPLAKVMRKELKARGIESGVKALYSEEAPIEPNSPLTENGKHIPASISYVPAVAGLLLAKEVLLDLMK